MSRKVSFKASLYKSLVEGFSNQDLSELEYLQGFEALDNYFNNKADVKRIVTEVMDHVERHLLWQELLDWIAIKNPKRFAHHQIRFPGILFLQIPKRYPSAFFRRYWREHLVGPDEPCPPQIRALLLLRL